MTYMHSFMLKLCLKYTVENPYLIQPILRSSIIM